MPFRREATQTSAPPASNVSQSGAAIFSLRHTTTSRWASAHDKKKIVTSGNTIKPDNGRRRVFACSVGRGRATRRTNVALECRLESRYLLQVLSTAEDKTPSARGHVYKAGRPQDV